MNIKIDRSMMIKVNRRRLRTALLKPKWVPTRLWIWFLRGFVTGVIAKKGPQYA